MDVLEKFAEHFITQNPLLADCLTFILILMIFIVSPYLIYVLLSERYNKGRFIFQKKEIGQDQREHLYLLDTMKGQLYWVDGKAHYSLMHIKDWKKERAESEETGQ